MDTIKADSGCSLPTIRKAIANLERESAIKVTREKNILMFMNSLNLQKILKG